MHLKLLPPPRVWQKTAPVFGGRTVPRPLPPPLPTTAGVNLCPNSPHEGSRTPSHHIKGGDTMSQRNISAIYSLYRSYIEQGKYDLAKTTYERYLDTIPVNMLEVAIYDYIVG